VCAEVFGAAGHARDIAVIEALLPVVDEYYEERYREDDAFWTSDAGASDVWVGMYTLLCRRLDIPEGEAVALGASVYREFGDASRWRAYPDVEPEFRRLRDSGVKVGIVSNWDTRLESILDGLGLGALIDTVVCSAAEGLHKPDRRIFELACARLGVEPRRSVHVGDHMYADVAGSCAAGLTPVLIERRGTAAGAAKDSVTRIVTLEQLEGALL
jgi:putative hydrolase of the HAD superfamily